MIEDPIVNLAIIDVVGVRNDGGLDLGISCQADLDSTPKTIAALTTKVRNYMREALEAMEPSLRERFGCGPEAKVRILIFCPHLIYPKTGAIIQDLKLECSAKGIDLIIDQSPRAAENS